MGASSNVPTNAMQQVEENVLINDGIEGEEVLDTEMDVEMAVDTIPIDVISGTEIQQ